MKEQLSSNTTPEQVMSLFQGAIEQESIFRSYDGGLFTLNIEDYISKHAEGRLMQHLDDLTE